MKLVILCIVAWGGLAGVMITMWGMLKKRNHITEIGLGIATLCLVLICLVGMFSQ